MADEYTIPIYITPVGSQNGSVSGLEGGEEYLPMQAPAGGGVGQNSLKNTTEKVKSDGNGAKAFARQIAGKVASTALNNYGNITGDYITQQNMQAAIGEVAAVSSAIALGPAGIAMYAVNKGLQAYNYISQIKRSETQAAFNQQRVYAAERKT